MDTRIRSRSSTPAPSSSPSSPGRPGSPPSGGRRGHSGEPDPAQEGRGPRCVWSPGQGGGRRSLWWSQAASSGASGRSGDPGRAVSLPSPRRSRDVDPLLSRVLARRRSPEVVGLSPGLDSSRKWSPRSAISRIGSEREGCWEPCDTRKGTPLQRAGGGPTLGCTSRLGPRSRRLDPRVAMREATSDAGRAAGIEAEGSPETRAAKSGPHDPNDRAAMEVSFRGPLRPEGGVRGGVRAPRVL